MWKSQIRWDEYEDGLATTGRSLVQLKPGLHESTKKTQAFLQFTTILLHCLCLFNRDHQTGEWDWNTVTVHLLPILYQSISFSRYQDQQLLGLGFWVWDATAETQYLFSFPVHFHPHLLLLMSTACMSFTTAAGTERGNFRIQISRLWSLVCLVDPNQMIRFRISGHNKISIIKSSVKGSPWTADPT